MKNLKNLLALLLSLILALSLGVPALAADETRQVKTVLIDGEEASITGPKSDLTIPFGADIVLTMEADLPAGVEITYQWRYKVGSADYAEGSVLRLSSGDLYYPNNYYDKPYYRTAGDYRCYATLVKKDAGDNVVDTQTISFDIRVNVEAERKITLRERFSEALQMALGLPGALGILTMGLGFVFFPIIFPVVFLIMFFTL